MAARLHPATGNARLGWLQYLGGALGFRRELAALPRALLAREVALSAAFVTGVTVAIDGGASVNNPVWPKAPHEPAPSFNGFHRATTPKVLQEL